jgi:vacuolar-type H+-ATPase subunit H
MSTKKSRGATQAASAPTNVATDAAIEVLTVTTGVQQAENQINNNLEPVKEEINQLDPFAAAEQAQNQLDPFAAAEQVQNQASNQVQNTVNQTSNQVQNTVNQTSNQVQNTVNQTSNQAQNTVNQTSNQAQNTVNQATNQAKNTVNQATTQAQSIKNKPKALVRPVGSNTNQAQNQAQNQVQNVANAVNTYNNDGYKNTVAEQKGLKSYGGRNRNNEENPNGMQRGNAAATLCLCCMIF